MGGLDEISTANLRAHSLATLFCCFEFTKSNEVERGRLERRAENRDHFRGHYSYPQEEASEDSTDPAQVIFQN